MPKIAYMLMMYVLVWEDDPVYIYIQMSRKDADSDQAGIPGTI